MDMILAVKLISCLRGSFLLSKSNYPLIMSKCSLSADFSVLIIIVKIENRPNLLLYFTPTASITD